MTDVPPRIHWVSPLPPAETDIAHYTGRILPALAARAEVVLWTDAERWEPWLEEHAEVRRYDPGAHAPLDMAGLVPGAGAVEPVFVHMGNNALFHAGPLVLARRMPTCVVFHDIALQDLSFGLVDHGAISSETYRDEMTRWYGDAGASAADRVLARKATPSEEAGRHPFPEIALTSAVAALTHTDMAFETITARCHVPCYQLDLPFAPGPGPVCAREGEGPLRLVQFGYIAPNRRLDQVLEALAALPPGVDFVFEIFGTVWDERHLAGKIAELGLRDRVRHRGFVAEAELDAALARAHLVFNLRHPTMGEASGSQLRIWAAGAASVVTDLGWYAGLPEQTVFRIGPEGEQAALAELVLRIDADRGLCAQVGAAGRARLEARHTPERYAEGILEVARHYRQDVREGLTAARGRALLDRLARRALARERLARLIAS